MTSIEAKAIIAKLGLTGKKFSSILGANTNYVSNFNRVGVPQNIGILLRLSEKLLERGASKEEIITLIKEEVEAFSVPF